MMLLAGLALAQDDGPGSDCQAFVGLAVPVAVGRRDWDLSAPPRQMPLPQYTASCFVGGLWVGVDLQPGATHLYEELSGRGPLTTTVSAGLPLFGRRPARLTTWFFANRSARGFGLAFILRDGDHALQIRVGATRGPVPTILSSVQFTPGRSRRLFRDRRASRIGLEVGTMNALRFERQVLDPGKGLAMTLGVRGGVLHRPARELFFAPAVLGHTVLLVNWDDWAVAVLQACAGGTWHDGAVHPTWGLAAPLGGEAMRLAVGALVVHEPERTRAFADVALSISW